MKIPRRLKEIISKHGDSLTIEHEKRHFVLVRSSGQRMPIDLGHVVTLDQWDVLTSEIKVFARDGTEK